MVWQLLAKPLLGVAADTVRGFVETKKAKAELKVTEIKAATKLKEDQIAGKIINRNYVLRPTLSGKKLLITRYRKNYTLYYEINTTHFKFYFFHLFSTAPE